MITAAIPDPCVPKLDLPATVQALRAIALRSLPRMYRPEQRLFAFRLRKTEHGTALEGISPRYTAIVLLGLATESEQVATSVLAGHSVQDVCGEMLRQVDQYQDVGEVALTLWAARALNHSEAGRALNRLKQMNPVTLSCPTVELSWVLTSLVYCGVADAELARQAARRLMGSYDAQSCLFRHWPMGSASPLLRRHVMCFADFVYPIQALSYYHLAVGCPEALEAASSCAARMCQLQGPQGQWWWHFDARTGRVVEYFPVYAVHQEAMAPMALAALEKAGGPGHTAELEKGLQWLLRPVETDLPLIDRQTDVIWRKVARHEPGKLVRGLQAMASCLHPSLRIPGLDLVFHPGWIDYETRPYCMGWILHAWPRTNS